MIPPIIFLGGGRITNALCAGLRLAGDRLEIVVYDRNPQKTRRLRRESRVTVARDLESALKHAGILVVAVRPASVGQLLEQLATCGVGKRLCISLAAGVPLRRLQQDLRGVRWARAMPSPVCRVARGLTALCFARGVSKADRARAKEVFQRVGQVAEIPENQFDVFTTTYSSSHGYHALKTLAEAAQKSGLDRKTALAASAHALADGIAYWRESGCSLNELLHEAATPGGIAAATMAGMDEGGYARVVRRGLAAGIARARRNAKK